MSDHVGKRASLEAAYQRLYSKVVLAAAEADEPAMKAVALHTLEDLRDHLEDPDLICEENEPDVRALIPRCPVCRFGAMTLARRLDAVDVCLCLNCEVSMTVPHRAWRKLPQP